MSVRFFTCALVFSLSVCIAAAQNHDKYREDQLYAGANYNTLINLPNDIGQNNFSYGVQVGFIRDFPLNAACNRAIGVGLGYATNSYYTNLKADAIGNSIVFTAIPHSEAYIRNKIETHLVEFPIEFRWRTSTPEAQQFWRVYAGVLFSYAFASISKFIAPNYEDIFHNNKVRSFQYSVYVTFNFKTTWNIYLSYALNTLLEKDTIMQNGQNLQMRPIQIGVRLYFF